MQTYRIDEVRPATLSGLRRSPDKELVFFALDTLCKVQLNKQTMLLVIHQAKHHRSAAMLAQSQKLGARSLRRSSPQLKTTTTQSRQPPPSDDINSSPPSPNSSASQGNHLCHWRLQQSAHDVVVALVKSKCRSTPFVGAWRKVRHDSQARSLARAAI